MINIEKAKKSFNNYISKYNNQTDSSFNLKLVHTMHVVKLAEFISRQMNLSEEDINLAKLIALLHDIGRFEEIKTLNKFDSVRNDHALYASKILFDDNLIRDFVNDDSYDNIIKKAIENHNKLCIESGLNHSELLHSRIIRDADKLDNFRVRSEESICAIFPSKFKTIEEFNNSLISDTVYQSILNGKCVNIKDMKYPLDYWLCTLAFIFDFNFKETFLVVKNNNYINTLIDKFNYTDDVTKVRMEIIRNILTKYIDRVINENDLEFKSSNKVLSYKK